MTRETGAVGLAAFLAVALISLVLTTYRDAPENGFHLDDFSNVVERDALQPVEITWDAIGQVLDDALLPTRPLANLSLAIDWYRGGGDPSVFQRTNVTIHTLTSVAIFALLVSVMRAAGYRGATATWGAALAAAAWALHPIQVQAVTYIVQRMASLATLFVVLAVLCYIRGRLAPRHGWTWFAASLLATALGLLSKESAAIAPVLLVLAEYGVCRPGRPLLDGWRDRLLLLGLPLLAVGALAADALAQGPISQWLSHGYAQRDFTLGERLLTQPRVQVFHFGQMLWPLPGRFSLEHDFAVSESLWSPPSTAFALAAVIGWVGAGLRFWTSQRFRVAGFCMLWVPAALLITSSLVPLEMVFEHRWYLPSVGLAGLLCLGICALLKQGRRRTVASVAALVLASLSMATTSRIPDWRDGVALATQTTKHAPRSARAWTNLGVALHRANRSDDAIAALRQALDLGPPSAELLLTLGAAQLSAGDTQSAVQTLLEGSRMAPNDPQMWANLATAWLSAGEPEPSLDAVERAIQLDRSDGRLHYIRGQVLSRLSRPTEALASFGLAATARHAPATTHYQRGQLLLKLGMLKEAETAFTAYLNLLGSDADGYFMRALAHYEQGRMESAAADLGRAIELNPGDSEALARRADALTRLGRAKEAAEDRAAACALGYGPACTP